MLHFETCMPDFNEIALLYFLYTGIVTIPSCFSSHVKFLQFSHFSSDFTNVVVENEMTLLSF